MSKTETWSYNYGYDSDYRISSQSYEYSYRDFGQAVPASDNAGFTYTYNSKSEIIGAIRQASSMDSDGTLDIELDTSYNYYYDQIGNRTSSVTAEFPTVYTSNNLNQYTAISGIANPTYDADGNLLTCDGWTYTWNMENRLVKAEKGATRLEFNYDYMGRRIEKKVFSSNNLIKHLKFVYDGYKLIAELDGMNSNAQLRRYTWNAPETGLDTPLAMYNVAGSSTCYYRVGANKNVMALTSGKDVVAQYEYSPFGTIITQTGDLAAVNPFRFSSEYHDDETGLIYYNYRYYNPTLGRWLSRDPIGENGGENLYGFVENNPTMYFDKLGFQKNTSGIKPPIEVLPFDMNTPNIPRDSATGEAGKILDGKAGFTVTTPYGQCCCPDGTNGQTVLVQLLKDPDDSTWQVDSTLKRIANGERRLVKNPRGKLVPRVRGYTDPEWNEDFSITDPPHSGRRYGENGYVDAPGLSGQFFSLSSLFDYKKNFRVEAFCRCENEDIYTGNSAEFTFTRKGQNDIKITDLKYSNTFLGDINPSKYPTSPSR